MKNTEYDSSLMQSAVASTCPHTSAALDCTFTISWNHKEEGNLGENILYITQTSKKI